MKTHGPRILIGIVVVPAILAIVWSVPYADHSAASKWLMINTVLAYTTFLGAAALCHVVLRFLKLRKAWQYFVVMFVVSFLLSLGVGLYSVRGYEDLYHSRTQVVRSGALTSEGFALQISDSLQNSALFAAAFLLFWVIAVREPQQRNESA